MGLSDVDTYFAA